MKLADKMKALELLAKHLGLTELQEKLEERNAVTIYIPDNGRNQP